MKSMLLDSGVIFVSILTLKLLLYSPGKPEWNIYLWSESKHKSVYVMTALRRPLKLAEFLECLIDSLCPFVIGKEREHVI